MDSVAGAKSIGEVFAAHSQVCSVLLIIDTGLGRDGVLPADAPKIAQAINSVPGVKVVGVMTHEGTVYGAPDTGHRHQRELLSGPQNGDHS